MSAHAVSPLRTAAPALAPEGAPAPRQAAAAAPAPDYAPTTATTAASKALGAATATANAAAAAGDAATSAASAGTNAAAGSATSAAMSATAAAKSCTFNSRCGVSEIVFVEQVERRQADVGDLLLIESRDLKQRRVPPKRVRCRSGGQRTQRRRRHLCWRPSRRRRQRHSGDSQHGRSLIWTFPLWGALRLEHSRVSPLLSFDQNPRRTYCIHWHFFVTSRFAVLGLLVVGQRLAGALAREGCCLWLCGDGSSHATKSWSANAYLRSEGARSRLAADLVEGVAGAVHGSDRIALPAAR